MKVVVVGAGAVGAVVGALLEADEHDVQFWVRPARRNTLMALTVERVGGRTVRSKSARCLAAGDPFPVVDWVIVCVRGEQLDTALRELAPLLAPEQRVAIAAVSLQGVREQARAAGVRGPAYALHASFGCFADPAQASHYHWYPFSLPSTVTPDGDSSRLPEARALARSLAHAGLPTRSALSFTATMRFMVAMNSVLALGWEISRWDLVRLARDRALRRHTASAMHESVRLVVPQRSPLRLLPGFLFDWFLCVLPLLMGTRARQVWRHHGPKIHAQTEHVVRELLAGDSTAAQDRSTLRSLFERWMLASNSKDS